MARRYAVKQRYAAALQQRALLLVLVAVVFILGIIAGGISVGTLDSTGLQELHQYLGESLTRLGSEGAGYTSWQWVIVDEVLKPAGLIWLLGMSVIGVPLIAAVVFMRGFVLGFSVVFLIKSLVIRGIVFTLVALVPQNILLIPGLALAAVGAIAFSLGALAIVLGRPSSRDIYQHLRSEGSIVLAGCVLLFAGGVVKAYLVPAITALASRVLL